MDFISILSIFVLACFVGYYVVWSVTPALHTPLMAVTNAISSVIIVGALIAAAASQEISRNNSDSLGPIAVSQLHDPSEVQPSSGTLADVVEPSPELPVRGAVDPKSVSQQLPWAKWLGLLAVVFASINIFGGFAVTARMLAMYKKKER
jgi:NAD(P) transhydrogenase subunit alpha